MGARYLISNQTLKLAHTVPPLLAETPSGTAKLDNLCRIF